MIASLDGVVAAIAADSLVLDVGGVGYRVFAGPSTLAAARAGERFKVHTHHLVREDLQALYGFGSVEELGFFELLTTVTGVGPKVALAILSSRQVADLQLAIFRGDEAVLTAVGGVGKRLAAVAHPEAQRLDPERRGFGPRELHEALVRAGVVNGENGYMAVYTALNAKTGLFERAQRGRYVWRKPPPGP